ncbi:MAG: hypothetical protein IT178_13570 [Acidobacteria bacterium]|nr:hypothetical protein [Acidobacteriota bacterium]
MTASTKITVLPAMDDLRRIVAGMLGSMVRAEKGKAVAPRAGVSTVSAVYIDDTNEIVAVVALELDLAASLGAALTMIPARVAAEQVSRKQIDEMIFDNAREVLNVLTSALNRADGIHVRLATVHRTPAEPLPEAAAALVAAPGNRLDISLAVPNYGGGNASVYVI